MKNFIKTILLISVLTLSSCNLDQIEDLYAELDYCQSELEAALIKISNIEDRVYNLESAIEDLRSEVDDFYYEDWKDNVYDLEHATSNIESALEDLKYEL